MVFKNLFGSVLSSQASTYTAMVLIKADVGLCMFKYCSIFSNSENPGQRHQKDYMVQEVLNSVNETGLQRACTGL